MSDTYAALAVARTVFRAWTINSPVVLAYRLYGRTRNVAIQYRYIVRKVNGQFNKTRNSPAFIIPRGLMHQLVLPITDGLIGVGGTGLNHLTDYLPGFFTMAVVQILAYDVAVTFDCTFVLIKNNTFLVAYCCGEVYCIKVVE